MRKAHMARGVILIGLLLAVGPAGANMVWSNFNDPFPVWAARYDPGTGRSYPIKWMPLSHDDQDALWRVGDAQGWAAVVNHQLRLTGNGAMGISGGPMRYDDCMTDASLEFTIPDFAAVRAMSEEDFFGLRIGIWTNAGSFFTLRRDVRDAEHPDEIWRIDGYYNWNEAGTHRQGEIIPLTETTPTRVSLKFVRSGNRVDLYAAYDENATRETPEGFFQEGNFHLALENYQLDFSERDYNALRIVFSPSINADVGTPPNTRHVDNRYGEVFIDDMVLSGPLVPKIMDAPGDPLLMPQNFGGPDWPPLMVRTDGVLNSGWFEVGQRLEFSVTQVTGIYPAEYQWLLDESPISGATTRVYVKDPLDLDDGGWYRCRVTNPQTAAKAEILTAPVLVSVFPAGSLPATGIAGLCVAGLACIFMAGVIGLRRTLAARKAR